MSKQPDAGHYPLRVQHYAFEPAHSLLLRTAAKNGTSLFSTVYKGLGVDHGRSVHKIDVAVIAAKCRANLEALAHSTANFRNSAEFNLLGQTLGVDHWGGFYRRWCPQCLAEAPYHRAWWDLSIITTCPDHGVELVSACACDKKLMQGRQPIMRCRVNHDLSAVAALPVASSELAADRFILARLKGEPSPNLAILDTVKLRDAIDIMEWLGKLRLTTTGSIFEVRKEVGQRRLLNAGFGILSNFPIAFDQLLEDAMAGNAGRRDSRRRWGIGHAYGEMHPWLSARTHSNPTDPLARILKERLDGHAAANVLLREGYLPEGKPVLSVPLSDLAERCGMGREVFLRLVRQLELVDVQPIKGVPRRVSEAHAANIVDRLTSLVTMEQAAAALNISERRVVDLVDDGLIDYLDRPYERVAPAGKRGDQPSRPLRDRPSNKWLFEVDAVEDFLERIEQMVLDGVGTADDLMPLSAVTDLYTQILRAVQMVLAGDLRIRGIDSSATGLSRLMVSRSEAAEAFKFDRRGGHWSLRDAAPLMGLNYNQVRGCVKAGLLVPLGAGKGTYFTNEIIDHFKRDYVTAGEIAEQFGWPGGSRVAIRHIREAGIEPLGGKADLGITLYRRDVVMPIVARLSAPVVFASAREREAHQKSMGLEVVATRRSHGR